MINTIPNAELGPFARAIQTAQAGTWEIKARLAIVTCTFKPAAKRAIISLYTNASHELVNREEYPLIAEARDHVILDAILNALATFALYPWRDRDKIRRIDDLPIKEVKDITATYNRETYVPEIAESHA